MFVDFHVINPPTISDFKLPMAPAHHWTRNPRRWGKKYNWKQARLIRSTFKEQLNYLYREPPWPQPETGIYSLEIMNQGGSSPQVQQKKSEVCTLNRNTLSPFNHLVPSVLEARLISSRQESGRCSSSQTDQNKRKDLQILTFRKAPSMFSLWTPPVNRPPSLTESSGQVFNTS